MVTAEYGAVMYHYPPTTQFDAIHCVCSERNAPGSSDGGEEGSRGGGGGGGGDDRNWADGQASARPQEGGWWCLAFLIIKKQVLLHRNIVLGLQI